MFQYLVSLPRTVKSAILLFVDLFLVPFSLYCAIGLRYGAIFPTDQIANSFTLFFVLTAVAVPLILLTGLNRIKLVAFETHDIWRGAAAAIVLALIAVLFGFAFGLADPLSVPLIFGPFFWMSHISTRMFARSWLLRLSGRNQGRVPVAIYGAGSAGVQLLSALRQDFHMRPVFFVDDNLTLQSMTVSGLPVYSRAKLEKMVRAGAVKRVVLAIPSANSKLRRERMRDLTELGCEVQVLPSFSELLGGTGLAESLKPVTPDMLLGRDKVDLDIPEITKVYAGRSILITGAGGSIGSELCRQLLKCNAHRMVLFDQSEYALYSIEQELRETAEGLGVDLVARLGSVCDPDRVAQIMAEAGIDIVLHAAAYKHVPLVEQNEVEGVRNNVLGTQVLASAACKANVERFILISSDKAVRPTNIMGASKRMAEMVVQDLQTRNERTQFAMVRFGNVLGSSGSVIPLFQEQIAAGGPVTVTDDNVTRYFMNISEAARLVLLAGAYASSGDVFVLNMGEPVNIRQLAQRLIELSGRTVRDALHPFGDIEIKTVGLRPGEKLHEELLIGDKLLPTPHEKILRAQETFPSQIEVAKILKHLRFAISSADADAIRRTIREGVDGCQSVRAASDLLG